MSAATVFETDFDPATGAFAVHREPGAAGDGNAKPNGAGAGAAGCGNADPGAKPNGTGGPQHGADPLLREFLDRAAALPDGASGGAVDALLADIVGSAVETWAFKRLAAAIAKTTGYDGSEILKRLLKARAARENAAAGAGLAPVADPEPLADVLAAIVAVLERQVWCAATDRDAAALWIAGTHGYWEADIFPRGATTSPTKRCGKTTLLETVAALAFNPTKADNISGAALFRLIASEQGTLCIDEVDSFLQSVPDMRNVLNAGYARAGTVIRNEPTPDGKSWAPVKFPCFCPVWLSGIGNLPDTVMDRSIVIKLQRAPKDARAQRRMRTRELLACRDRIVPHLLAHSDGIAAAIGRGVANLPGFLDDRAADNWEPLLAVAELAGGDWPRRALAAARALSAERAEDTGLSEKLLEDIRWIVEAPRRHAVEVWREWRDGGRVGARPARVLRAQRPTEIRTADLLGCLVGMAHRPWATARRGQPITEEWLAARLRRFGVKKPGRGRVPAWNFDADGNPSALAGPLPAYAVAKGGQNPRLRTYLVAELRAAWRKYL